MHVVDGVRKRREYIRVLLTRPLAHLPRVRTRSQAFATEVGKALRRAAREAHRIARMHGTPIYVWENGKVVAKKPWL